MTVLQVEHVSKAFSGKPAVIDLSFTVAAGEIFALLGPNGAGKTSTIRMVLDLLRSDSGQIKLWNGPISQSVKDRIGYLPEERGLYRDLAVLECLVYLGTLKGMARQTAQSQARHLLATVGLSEVAAQPVKSLSRGMQQKVQFIATILHEPDLIIIDEPFSGLDPVNTQLIKQMIYDMKAAGKTVIMSTHMMHQVEEMADRMLMMFAGRAVLYGGVNEIRHQKAAHAVYIQGTGDWATLPGIMEATYDEGQKAHYLRLAPELTPQSLLHAIASRPAMEIERFEVALPSLEDIFVAQVEGAGDGQTA